MECSFPYFEAKEAVEVIEVSDDIRSVEVIEATEVFKTTQILKINNIMARIPFLVCFFLNISSSKYLNKVILATILLILRI